MALNYLKKATGRLVHMLFLLWITLSILFMALTAIKGNPIGAFLDPRLTPAMEANLKKIYGYQATPIQQYRRYLTQVVRGNFGISFTFKKPVSQVLRQRIGPSLWLGSLSIVSALGFSLIWLTGIHLSQRTILQRLCRGFIGIFLVLPPFVLATGLIALLGTHWRLFPIFGSMPLFESSEGLWDQLITLLYHSTLPVLSLSLPLAGLLTAYLHERLEILREAPFVLSARGRGLSESRIFFNHKLRVLMPNLFQLLSLYFPTLASGSLIIEAIFGWQGLGPLLFDAVTSRDLPLILGAGIWVSCLVIPCYQLADHLRRKSRLEAAT